MHKLEKPMVSIAVPE